MAINAFAPSLHDISNPFFVLRACRIRPFQTSGICFNQQATCGSNAGTCPSEMLALPVDPRVICVGVNLPRLGPAHLLISKLANS